MNHKSNVEFTFDGTFGTPNFRGFADVEAQYLPAKIEADTVAILSYVACLFINGEALFL